MSINLPERLRWIVGRSGLTYDDLAALSGLGRMHVYKVVNGINARPAFWVVEKIVAAAGGTMAELCAEEEGDGTGG